MATITKRGKSFQVEIRKKGFPSKSRCFGTLKEAKAWALQEEGKIEASGSPLRTVRERAFPILKEAIERYCLEVTPSKKSASKEVSFLKFWGESKLAPKRLSQITPADISQLRDQLLRQGRAPSSVVRLLACLSHVFTVARLDWGLPLLNPVESIRKPKVTNARARRPSKEELSQILANITNKELRLFVLLASETAMRRSELFQLRWEHVDLVRGYVYLRDTKNGEARVVVTSNAALEYFAQLTPKSEGRVFRFKHVDTPSKAFARAVKLSRTQYVGECGEKGVEPRVCHLTNLRLHDMRHEATSAFFEKGLSIPEVASITGHKTLAMLARYTHLTPKRLANRIQRVD